MFGDRDRVATARLRRFAPRLPLERRWLLPPGSQGGRRLPCAARNSLVRAADDRNIGPRRPPGASPQKDDAALGRAVALRSQGRAQAARLSLERRGRCQTKVMVCRPRRKPTGRGNRVSQNRYPSSRRGAIGAGVDSLRPIFDPRMIWRRNSRCRGRLEWLKTERA